MKNLLFIILIAISSIAFSQDGGRSSFNLKLIPSVGSGTKIGVFDDYGRLKSYNLKPIVLTGTTPTWDIQQSLNAIIELSGNTTITMANLVDGLTGNIKVLNPSSYTLTIDTNYPNDIIGLVRISSNQLKVNSAKNAFSWWFVGGYVTWNGGNNYN